MAALQEKQKRLTAEKDEKLKRSRKELDIEEDTPPRMNGRKSERMEGVRNPKKNAMPRKKLGDTFRMCFKLALVWLMMYYYDY